MLIAWLHFFSFYLIPYYSLLQLFSASWTSTYYELLIFISTTTLAFFCYRATFFSLAFSLFRSLHFSCSLLVSSHRAFSSIFISNEIVDDLFSKLREKRVFIIIYIYIYFIFFFCNKLSEQCLIRKTSRDSYQCLRVAYILT